MALLLWGIHMVQTGVERAFGPSLRRVLRTHLRNRLAAMASGLALCAVLQSSTATGLMVAGSRCRRGHGTGKRPCGDARR